MATALGKWEEDLSIKKKKNGNCLRGWLVLAQGGDFKPEILRTHLDPSEREQSVIDLILQYHLL